MKPVAFGHRKGTGKNTAATFLFGYLKSECPKLKIARLSFAESLKSASQVLYGWAGLQSASYYEVNRKEKEIVLPKINKSPREIWINIAENLRNYDPAIFINATIQPFISNDIVIFSDLRNLNEVEYIKAMNGIVCRIDRGDPKHDTIDDYLSHYENWDYIFTNNTTVADLMGQVKKLGQEIIRSFK